MAATPPSPATSAAAAPASGTAPAPASVPAPRGADYWGRLPASALGYAHALGEAAQPVFPQYAVRRAAGVGR